jgi:hypothetical protein
MLHKAAAQDEQSTSTESHKLHFSREVPEILIKTAAEIILNF